jgi:hypothetical protein
MCECAQAQFWELRNLVLKCPNCQGALKKNGWSSKSNGLRRVLKLDGEVYLLSYTHACKRGCGDGELCRDPVFIRSCGCWGS